MSPTKVLAAGSVLGQFREFFEKVKAIDGKYGKFELLVCAGDFFDSPGVAEDQIVSLLSNEIQIPIQTYVTLGANPIPPAVRERAQASGGEVCPNLHILDKATVQTTTTGLRLANLGGVYAEETFGSDDGLDLGNSNLTTEGINHLYSQLSPQSSATTSRVDILLTHQWPASIANISAVPLPKVEQNLQAVAVLDGVVSTIKPRYHFVAQSSRFWEREPIEWEDDGTPTYTRFLGLGSFGEQASSSVKKQRWFYAFNINTAEQSQVKPANATKSPFGSVKSSVKRSIDAVELPQENYIWGSTEPMSKKSRPSADDSRSRTMVCRTCQSTEHMSKDCPKRETPHEGYVCRKCNQPGHFIRDCPNVVLGDTGGKKPREGYVCRACGSDGHYIQDCPTANNSQQEKGDRTSGSNRRGGGRPKEIRPEDCWFCLSNTRVAKHLLVSIGSECYLTLPKGQIHPTGPRHPPNPEWSPIPGGGHVLIVPIEHHSTTHALPEDVKAPIVSEIESTKDGVRKCYAAHQAVAVVFEMAKLSEKGGHAHIQVVPIPLRLQDGVEKAFRGTDVAWEENPEQALIDAQRDKASFFRVELPNGGLMVHIIKGYFELQFGRIVLAKLLGVPERSDWKACALSEEDEIRDVQTFKSVFAPYDASAN